MWDKDWVLILENTIVDTSRNSYLANNILTYKHPLEDFVTKELEDRLISDSYKNQMIEMYKVFEEETLMPDLIGKAILVNESQMPNIYAPFAKFGQLLEMKVPPVYLFEGLYTDVNAEGLDKPWIQITARTLENCTAAELEYLIARQMVHIKLGHMKYEILCEQFTKSSGIATQYGSSLVSFFPGASTLTQGASELYSLNFRLLTSRWSRVSEYSADRCALVLIGWDIETALGAIKKQIFNSKLLADNLKLSGYLRQTEAILSLKSPVAKYSVMDEMYPYGPFRMKELISFASLYSGLSIH